METNSFLQKMIAISSEFCVLLCDKVTTLVEIEYNKRKKKSFYSKTELQSTPPNLLGTWKIGMFHVFTFGLHQIQISKFSKPPTSLMTSYMEKCLIIFTPLPEIGNLIPFPLP